MFVVGLGIIFGLCIAGYFVVLSDELKRAVNKDEKKVDFSRLSGGSSLFMLKFLGLSVLITFLFHVILEALGEAAFAWISISFPLVFVLTVGFLTAISLFNIFKEFK